MLWMIRLAILSAIVAIGLSASGQPLYTGAYGEFPHCEACHSDVAPTDQYPYWNATPHAAAYDSLPEVQWNEDCLPCHTSGWDLTHANGGFDDFFYIGDTLGMMGLRNVQCEACHGPTDEYPHPATTVVDYHSEVCGGCHTYQERPVYNDWAAGGHAQIAPPTTQQLACARCHEAISASVYVSTGQPLEDLPEDPLWQVTCGACHAMHSRSTYGSQLYQLPDTLCRVCHTMEDAVVGEDLHAPQKEMLIGLGSGAFEWPGYEYVNSCHECYLPSPCQMCHMYTDTFANPDSTETGHSVAPDIQICIVCHETWVPPDSSFDFLGAQSEIDSLLAVLGVALANADTSIIEYAQAKFDYDFVVNDGSRGIHNFLYAEGLLISSIEGLGAVMPDVNITLTPYNPPITIPASGGSFDCNAMVMNNEPIPVGFDVWIMVQLPSGSWFGPVLGPVDLMLFSGQSIARDRSQYVPAAAPAGTYTYEGYVGFYPGEVWNSDSFSFEKTAAGDGSPVNGWTNSGQGFDEQFAEPVAGTPSAFALIGAYPNPFNPVTAISYQLSAVSFLNLAVYDVSGRKVAELVNGWRDAGVHEVTFDGADLVSGIYVYRLETGGHMASGKMVLMK